MHVIGAIGCLGLIYHGIKRGAFKKEDVAEWVRRCLRAVILKHGGPVILVLDNAPYHSGIEDILSETEFQDCRFLRLSLYSPVFNLIENV